MDAFYNYALNRQRPIAKKMEGHLNKVITKNINLEIENYFHFYTNFGGVNKLLEINGIVQRTDDNLELSEVVEKLQNTIINFDNSINYFVTLKDEYSKIINNVNDVYAPRLTCDFVNEFMERTWYRQLIFIDISKHHQFNLNSIDKIFEKIILLDEFFVDNDTSRIYKQDNFYFFLNYGT